MHTGNGSGDGVLSVVTHDVSASADIERDGSIRVHALDTIE